MYTRIGMIGEKANAKKMGGPMDWNDPHLPWGLGQTNAVHVYIFGTFVVYGYVFFLLIMLFAVLMSDNLQFLVSKLQIILRKGWINL